MQRPTLHSTHLQKSHRPVAFVLYKAEMKVRSLHDMVMAKTETKGQGQGQRAARDPARSLNAAGMAHTQMGPRYAP